MASRARLGRVLPSSLLLQSILPIFNRPRKHQIAVNRHALALRVNIISVITNNRFCCGAFEEVLSIFSKSTILFSEARFVPVSLNNAPSSSFHMTLFNCLCPLSRCSAGACCCLHKFCMLKHSQNLMQRKNFFSLAVSPLHI